MLVTNQQHPVIAQQSVTIHQQASDRQPIQDTASPLVLFSLIAAIALWAIAIDRKERAYRNSNH